jgi:hypothetical protein
MSLCWQVYALLYLLLQCFVQASCPGYLFFDEVQTQCSYDIHHNLIAIEVTPINLKTYNYTSDDAIMISINDQSAMVSDYAVPLRNNDIRNANALIGVALDGYPIYSALDEDGSDIVSIGLASGSIQIDQCGGMIGPTTGINGDRYHYRVMPSCILEKNKIQEELRTYISSVYELLEAYSKLDSPIILGYTLSGNAIFSPLTQSMTSKPDIDLCNGKWVNDTFSYYTTPYFPYIQGCKDIQVNDSTNFCPSTHYYQAAYSSGTRERCVPCPAGRYSTKLSGQDSISYCNTVAPMGHYAKTGSANAYPCPGGRYGSSIASGTDLCSGSCQAGYICSTGSITSNPEPCGNASYYCPSSSTSRVKVDQGYFSGPEDIDESTRYEQIICPPSSYCSDGKKYPCPAGRYGAESGLTSANCTNACGVGHYCPLGSAKPSKCPSGRYGDSEMLTTPDCSGLCSPGYWCEEGSISMTQNPCASGRYGSEYGLTNSNCSSICSIVHDPSSESPSTKYCLLRFCSEGYYCREASTSSQQNKCGGPHVYCPPASVAPITVSVGYYSIGRLSRMQEMQSLEDELTRTGESPCEPGFYCVNGTKNKCLPGYFGNAYKLTDARCSGPCSEGFYCPSASISETALRCGNATVYCPSASSLPLNVQVGYYSVGGTISTRTAMRRCEAGYYCIGDGIRRPCPSGRYSLNGSATSDCDGLCSSGYYCLEGSPSPIQYNCPAGRYGSAGMKSDACSGEKFSSTVICYRDSSIYCVMLQAYAYQDIFAQKIAPRQPNSNAGMIMCIVQWDQVNLFLSVTCIIVQEGLQLHELVRINALRLIQQEHHQQEVTE